MHLEQIKISRFRSCEETTVHFQPDLTVLVGENNGGKSNVIDAIRLVTAPLSGRRDRYAEADDLRHGSDPANFAIEAQYAGLSPASKGLLIAAVPDPAQDRAVFGLRYEGPATASGRGRCTQWAGKFDTAEPEPGSTDLIRHVYLPALRDAHQALGTGGAARIMSLFRHFLGTREEEVAFLETVQRGGAAPPVLGRMNDRIVEALGELTGGVRKQSAQVDFGNATLLDVARDLRFKLGDAGIDPTDIRSSGLGYANLLFMATVVVELTKADEADLTIFLVEEPEAHLHPQLQMLVLEFLLERARAANRAPLRAGHPEGRIQVVVTTHSPNLTAWVAPKHLVVVRSQAGEHGTTKTGCVPIAKLEIDERQLNKVSRYLDVTRSALLFGNRAVLVEGVAEALLLPVIAESFVLNGDREALLRFKGAVLVPIEGVDFEPYVEVLLKPCNGARIADRLVVITDGDPNAPGDRVRRLTDQAARLDAADALTVQSSEITLEHELFTAGNAELLRSIVIHFRERADGAWARDIAPLPVADQAAAFLEFFKARDIRKGDFAQELAARISVDGAAFVVPNYLRQAILTISAP